MDITKIIKDLLFAKKLTLTQLNDLLNKKNNTNYSVQNLSRKLISDNLKFKDVEDILDVLDYSIEIVENRQLKMPLDEIAVTTDTSAPPYDDEEEEEEYEEPEISNLFQGKTTFKKMVREELEKQLRQMISDQTNLFIKEALSDSYNANNKDKK